MSIFIPKTWNAEERANPDGTFTTNFTSSWMNRRTDDGLWEKINIDFTEDSTSFSLKGTPFGFSAPKNSGGAIRFTNSVNFDPNSGVVINDLPIGKTKIFTGTNNVSGELTPDGILYKNAYSFGDILIQSNQEFVKQLVVFNTEPSGTGDIEIPFIQELDNGISVKKIDGSNVSLLKERDSGRGIAFTDSSTRSIFTKPAYVWDSSGKSMAITILTRKIGKILSCRKIIPRTFLSNAVYPVFTDTIDTFTSDTADAGIVSDGGSSWANTRGGLGSLALDGGSASVAKNYVVAYRYDATNYAAYRYFAWWATGATIPSGNTISSASLDVFFSATHAALSRTMYLVENRQASTTLATSDFTNIGASGVGTGTGQPFGSITRGVSDASATYTFTINSDGISKIAKGSGNTFFTICESDDWNNSTPGSENTTGSDLNSANSASNKPTLSITHAPPVSSKFILLGVG